MNLHVTSQTADGASGAAHPLDPLDAVEIAKASSIIGQHYRWGDDLRVETIDIAEPDKATVRSHTPGDAFARIARYNVYKRGRPGVQQGLIDLRAETIISEHFNPEARAMVALAEVLEIEATVKADARFQEALRRRGLIDYLDFMCIDPWTVGDFGHEIEKGRRVLNCFVWMRTFPLDNYYAHPVEGLHALIDLSNLEVLKVEDHFADKGDYIPVPMTPLNFDAEVLTRFRPPSAPLDVVQPNGAGFKVDGHRVTWENWDFRVGFNGREGLVLNTVGYTVDGRRRPVLYRASIAEMVVPYGSPERSHYRKNVFDSGEIGFGRMANSLKLGCDCLGVIHYFDAVVPDVFGNPRTIENCICLHEEDAGLSWKHFDVRTERTEVRRARKLVISSISTIGNYEYASYWYLHQDGRIEYEMKATGIINTAACHPGDPGRYGAEVAPGIVGHIHQHLFSARLDVEIDGPNNTVVECDTIAPPPGPENPYGNAFLLEETVLPTENSRHARRRFQPDALLEDHQPPNKKLAGPPDRLQARGALSRKALHASRQPLGPPLPVHPAPVVGDALRPGRALSRGRIRQSIDWGRWHRDLDPQGSPDRGRRHCPLAYVRVAPPSPTGRPSGAGVRGVRLHSGANRVLRSEPGDRPPLADQ